MNIVLVVAEVVVVVVEVVVEVVAVALVVEVEVDLSKEESGVMIPSYRRLAAPLVREYLGDTLKPWQRNLENWKVRIQKSARYSHQMFVALAYGVA